MPDQLTDAVVDIATQLRRIADHLTTPDDIRCPTPETHNWGCGCPTDTSALRMELDGQRQKAGDLAETVKAQRTELEQARKDAAFSDEAARRASQLRQDMATERYALQEQRDQLAATLHDVLSHFVHPGHPGEPCLGAGWISVKTVAKWRAVLNPPTTEQQPDAR